MTVASGGDATPGARKRHIGLFVPDLSGGGAERMMVRLAAAFASQGDRVDLILVEAKGPYLVSSRGCANR